ncbi:MAG TPA: sigma-54-dependent Fis family transcriptional regulator [Gammaproteobacteria bacterium]|nr:sigma-54-dependent Fis family transcriptional regulator [Gammaproteobacteria bacterium]
MGHGILIVEDEAILAKTVARYLRKHGFDVRTASDGHAGIEDVKSYQPDAVLLDFNLPGGMNGLEVLKRIQAIDSSIKIVMITGQGNTRLAVDAMKAGAYDYLSKPLALSELKLLLERAIGQQRTEGQLSYFHGRDASRSDIDRIVGESHAMLDLKQRIARIIDAGRRLSDGPLPAVLISGETGTGKELVARALHYGGPRAKQAFVELNAAAMPQQLVESELFGHEKGAFTDARERKLGLVEAANGGTLFLDEVGELDLAIQAKLLKLLEDRKVRRLGSLRDTRTDIQIVTATNRSLQEMVHDGGFREDLLFRLNTLTIHIPPLRDRLEDVPLLAGHFLEQMTRKYAKPDLHLAENTLGALTTYHWPGNIRELRNRIEQAVLLCEGSEIGVACLNLPTTTPHSNATHRPGADHAAGAPSTLPDVEKEMIEQTLKAVGGNVSKAARQLGITRDRLRYRLKKYGLTDQP